MQRCPRCQIDKPLEKYAPSNRGRNGTYCHSCVNDRRAELRPPLPPRPCERCGGQMFPTRTDQRFCSPECKRAKRYTPRPGPKPPNMAPLSRAGMVLTTGCSTCGEQFTYVLQRRERTLCDACRAKRGDRRDQLSGVLTVAERTRLRAEATECGICKQPNRGGFTNWHIDHCHTTGKVRGVLCGPCNLILGLCHDDPDRLAAAADYLRRHIEQE